MIKYYERKNIYKNSNGTNTFNPETCEALSYGWWVYVKRINGKVVFNNHSYSVTTSKHQGEMRRLLRELDIEIDLFIEAPNGLQELDSRHLELEKSKAFEKSEKARSPFMRGYWSDRFMQLSKAIQFVTEVRCS